MSIFGSIMSKIFGHPAAATGGSVSPTPESSVASPAPGAPASATPAVRGSV